MMEKEGTKKVKINISFVFFLIIFMPILLILLIIIIKAVIYPDKSPDLFGYKPFIVLADTKTEIKKDDLILTKVVDESQIYVGDIISYRANDIIETHEVVGIQKQDNETHFIINIAEEGEKYMVKVSSSIMEGKYLFRIAGLRWSIAMVSKIPYITDINTVNIFNHIYNILQEKRAKLLILLFWLLSLKANNKYSKN